MYKIMIVDDDLDMHNLYKVKLSQKGFDIISVTNGKETITKIKEEKPEVLLLDIMMPEIDGRSLLLDIRKYNSELPILFVSSKEGMAGDPEIHLSPQVYGFLKKPIDFEDLYKRIERILAQKQRDFTWREKRIGGCKLGKCIGRGGYGIVYEGTQGKKPVAVKILSKDAIDKENLIRAQREARSLAQINHENIIQLYDVGYTEQIFYIIMEYFLGSNIQDLLIKEGRFETSEAINIIKQAASGLGAAHKLGLIHRDMKPSNLLYNRDKKLLKVIDFGIVQEANSQKFIVPTEKIKTKKITAEYKDIMNRKIPEIASSEKFDVNQTLTQDGFIVGSPYYMSPEQCQGFTTDNRSDIYSLGVVFFQILVGRLPFVRSSITDTFFAHVFEPIGWSKRVEKYVPRDVKNIIEKMMHKIPAKRYQNVDEILEDLEKLI